MLLPTKRARRCTAEDRGRRPCRHQPEKLVKYNFCPIGYFEHVVISALEVLCPAWFFRTSLESQASPPSRQSFSRTPRETAVVRSGERVSTGDPNGYCRKTLALIPSHFLILQSRRKYVPEVNKCKNKENEHAE